MPLPPLDPHRAALVTGASSGIGECIARDLAHRGYQLVLVARSEEWLTEIARELGNSHVLVADLADRSVRAGLPARVADLGLTIDILVNNAGFSTMGPVHRASVEQEIALVDLDVTAVVDLTTRFVPGMVERGRGAVLNVASTAAFQPLPGQAAYSAAKAFVLTYTQSLSAELKGTGVSVTALCPGPVHTRFGETAGLEDEGDAMPSFMWVDANEVARQAVEGLDRGKLVVIPGVANRVGARFAQLTPRALLLPVVARNHPGLK